MAADKHITLITGGNSGIGLSLASLLIADPSKHVIITSRSRDKGEKALKDLQAMQLPGKIEMLQLEVTNPESIAKLADEVGKTYGRLDALVNNAAQAVAPPETSLFDHMQQCFATNVTGPALLIEAFLPLLKKSITTPRIINVSSGAGSNGLTVNPNTKAGPLYIPYKTSKAALNMLSSVFVARFRLPDSEYKNVKVFSYCPGFTVSNLGPNNNAEKGAQPTEDGARPMIPILNGEKDDQHGGYPNHRGEQYPW